MAADLIDFTGSLEREGSYDETRFTGEDLLRVNAPDTSFLDCLLDGTDLTEARLSGSRWVDCTFHRARGVGTELVDASLQDTALVEPRLGALGAYGSTWRRVTVTGGKIDFLNLRGATLKDVTFEDCVLVEPDFAGARLTNVGFAGCTLQTPQWSQATLTNVDLSGARLVAPLGLTSLRGATISRVQLIELGDAFADQLGITVTG